MIFFFERLFFKVILFKVILRQTPNLHPSLLPQANMDCSGVFNVNHYVPIDLISRAEWSSYGEVVVEETQVAIEFRLINLNVQNHN